MGENALRTLAIVIMLVLAIPMLATATPVAWGQAPVSLTINSQYASGQPLTGMWTTLSQNGQTVATGFSPAQFSLASGQQYVAAISNYGSIIFDHWADNGSTNAARTVSITQATTLTAVYRSASITLSPASGTVGTQVTVTGSSFAPNSSVAINYNGNAVATAPASVMTGSSGAFTASFAVPLSSMSGANTVQASTGPAASATATFTHQSSSSYPLTVSSQYGSGQALAGMWTVLEQNGQTVATGFTPVQFTLASSQQYTVTVGDYQSIVFHHWADNGSTNAARTISVTQPTSIMAVYGNGSNPPPVANGQSVSVNENAARIITLTGSDPDGQALQFFIASAPLHGTLGLVNQATVRYTPYDYYDGPDSFSFVANDGSSDSAPAIVNISVTNTATKTTSKAVVITAELNGHSATGMFTTLSQGSSVINSGYSHVDFDVNNNQQYTITVNNFENFLFDHWFDTGSTNPSRAVSISQDAAFLAVYKTAIITLTPSTGTVGTVVTVTGDGFDNAVPMSLTYNGIAVNTAPQSVRTDATGAFTATFTVPSWSGRGNNLLRATDATGISATATFTDNAISPTSALTIRSQNMSGGTLTGFWTTLAQNGQTIGTGFTPVTFTLSSGQQYTTTVSGYGLWRFDHWLDNGSTNPSRVVSIASDTTLTAVYRNTA
jgi:hypothetical protein